MTAILITGLSGAGKTSVASELTKRGLRCLDADADPTLARWLDPDGHVVARAVAPSLAWLATHSWQWDAARLDQLISEAESGWLFVCGHASNEIDLVERFGLVILLEMDETTMLERLDEKSRNSDFGRVGDTRDQLRRWLPMYQAEMRALGVYAVDATAPIEDVVEEILTVVKDGPA